MSAGLGTCCHPWWRARQCDQLPAAPACQRVHDDLPYRRTPVAGRAARAGRSTAMRTTELSVARRSRAPPPGSLQPDGRSGWSSSPGRVRRPVLAQPQHRHHLAWLCLLFQFNNNRCQFAAIAGEGPRSRMSWPCVAGARTDDCRPSALTTPDEGRTRDLRPFLEAGARPRILNVDDHRPPRSGAQPGLR